MTSAVRKTPLARVRAHPVGRVMLRIGVTLLGAAMILVGIVLLPLPGPGWVIIFSGLAVWSIEYRWARRVLGLARARVDRWRRWYATRSLLVRVTVGLAVGAALLVIVVGALRVSVGPHMWDAL